MCGLHLAELYTQMPRFIEEKADWHLFSTVTSEPGTIFESLVSNLNEEFSSFVSDINKAAHIAIPKTKAHDKVKPWECWWFNDELQGCQTQSTYCS